MDSFVLPKWVYISTHATEMYLQRVLNKPPTRRNFQAARLFLAHFLSNRVCTVIEDRQDSAGHRLKLQYKGIMFIYSPAEKQVYTTYPGEDNNCLEMKMRIPPDFTITGDVNRTLGKRLRTKLFQREWPVVSAKGRPCAPTSILILSVSEWLIGVDMRKKQVDFCLRRDQKLKGS